MLFSVGAWGVFLLAVLEGIGVPLPRALDLAVVGFVYRDPARVWQCVFQATAGSVLGGVILFSGGLLAGGYLGSGRISPARQQKIRAGLSRRPIWTIAVPAALAPAFSFRILVLCAGTFGMKRSHFLAAIITGRLVRFGGLSLLTLLLGPRIADILGRLFHNHWIPWLAVGTAATLIVSGRWARSAWAKRRQRLPSEQPE